MFLMVTIKLQINEASVPKTVQNRFIWTFQPFPERECESRKFTQVAKNQRSFPSVISCLISFGIKLDSYFSPPVKGKSSVHWHIFCGLVVQLPRKNIQVFFGAPDIGLFAIHLFN